MSLSALNNRSRFYCSETELVSSILSLPSDAFVVRNGLHNIDDLREYVQNNPYGCFTLSLRLRGGKGGFGTLLRSFRINRSTNQLMCRDLTGRRLADVEEEKKLKKWIETAADREKEKEEKKKAKYEKLRAATQEKPKHDFNDSTYIETREKILDETDDAFEAGFDHLKRKKRKPEETVQEEEEEEEESDGDIAGSSTFTVKPKRRRTEEKKSGSSSSPSNSSEERGESNTPEESETEQPVEKETEQPEAVVVEEKKVEEEVKVVEEPKKEKKKYEKPVDVPTDFPPVDIDSINDVKELESLGLFHLKHALESRGLKCGGSLEERAARLLSVKGLSPDEYPKAIRAPKAKK